MDGTRRSIWCKDFQAIEYTITNRIDNRQSGSDMLKE